MEELNLGRKDHSNTRKTGNFTKTTTFHKDDDEESHKILEKLFLSKKGRFSMEN